MIYIIKRDDAVISVLEGPPLTNLLTMETTWIEDRAKPSPTVAVGDPKTGATCVIDAFQQAKAAHTWDEFQAELLASGSFILRGFREYETLMRMNHNGPSRSGTVPDVDSKES